MTAVYADIELLNGGGPTLPAGQYGDNGAVTLRLQMLVDTSAYHMCINETIQQQLRLPVLEKRKAQLADSFEKEYDVVGPVEVRFKNRKTLCNALVLPGDSEPLLGAIPLENMEVWVHPKKPELIENTEHYNMD